MAEFQEVMRQALRMHRRYAAQVNCGECPIKGGNISRCRKLAFEDAANFEREVMVWAAKNPEPHFLTWREWRDANFPSASEMLTPCYFMAKDAWIKASGATCFACGMCLDMPIPADIAKKLNVQIKDGVIK